MFGQTAGLGEMPAALLEGNKWLLGALKDALPPWIEIALWTK